MQKIEHNFWTVKFGEAPSRKSDLELSKPYFKFIEQQDDIKTLGHIQDAMLFGIKGDDGNTIYLAARPFIKSHPDFYPKNYIYNTETFNYIGGNKFLDIGHSGKHPIALAGHGISLEFDVIVTEGLLEGAAVTYEPIFKDNPKTKSSYIKSDDSFTVPEKAIMLIRSNIETAEQITEDRFSDKLDLSKYNYKIHYKLNAKHNIILDENDDLLGLTTRVKYFDFNFESKYGQKFSSVLPFEAVNTPKEDIFLAPYKQQEIVYVSQQLTKPQTNMSLNSYSEAGLKTYKFLKKMIESGNKEEFNPDFIRR